MQEWRAACLRACLPACSAHASAQSPVPYCANNVRRLTRLALHPPLRLQGRVFAWIDRMLSAPAPAARLADWGPPKDAVGRGALTNLLQSNSNSNSDLAAVFVDRAYSADQQVAAGYFQVRGMGWLD